MSIEKEHEQPEPTVAQVLGLGSSRPTLSPEPAMRRKHKSRPYRGRQIRRRRPKSR
jgi:hypothetical protein